MCLLGCLGVWDEGLERDMAIRTVGVLVLAASRRDACELSKWFKLSVCETTKSSV